MTVSCHFGRFYLFSMYIKTRHGFGASSSHGNLQGICQEYDGISTGFGLIFDQTTAEKARENPYHIFQTR